MWIPWAGALAAFLLAAGGAALTALRSSLLIVGEEGLAEDASAGKEIAAELLSTVRDPEVRHPFSLWVAASAFKTVAGLCAGVAAVSLFGHLRGWAGAASAAGWVLLFLILLFCLENLSTQGAMTNPRRILQRGGGGGPCPRCGGRPWPQGSWTASADSCSARGMSPRPFRTSVSARRKGSSM